MAKFSVGEKAIYEGSWEQYRGCIVEILDVGPYPIGFKSDLVRAGDGVAHLGPGMDDYVSTFPPVETCFIAESVLRKLPPDSHTDNTTEDPGVMRLKKLLEQDTKPQKRRKGERA